MASGAKNAILRRKQGLPGLLRMALRTNKKHAKAAIRWMLASLLSLHI
jgi:hypothetical protein